MLGMITLFGLAASILAVIDLLGRLSASPRPAALRIRVRPGQPAGRQNLIPDRYRRRVR